MRRASTRPAATSWGVSKMWMGGKSRSSASRGSMYARAELVVPRSMPIFMLVPAYVRRGGSVSFPMGPSSRPERRGVVVSTNAEEYSLGRALMVSSRVASASSAFYPAAS